MADRERPARQRLPRQRAAADLASRVATSSPRSRRRGAPRSSAIAARPTASISATGRVSQRSTGSAAAGRARRDRAAASAASAARSSLSGRSARRSGLAREALDHGRPGRRRCPACGPPSSLSPLKVTRSAPAATRSRTTGSLGRPSAERSTSAPLPRSSITGTPRSRPSGDQLPQRDRRGEADDAVVAGVHLEQRRRVRSDRRDGSRRRACDWSCRPREPRAALRHHLGHAERAADLDQLAARHHHLAALGQRVQRQQDGGGVVVDDERRLGAGERAQIVGDQVVAVAAPAGVEVELEVDGLAARAVDKRVDRRVGERARGRGSCAARRRSRSRPRRPQRVGAPRAPSARRSNGAVDRARARRPARMSSRSASQARRSAATTNARAWRREQRRRPAGRRAACRSRGSRPGGAARSSMSAAYPQTSAETTSPRPPDARAQLTVREPAGRCTAWRTPTPNRPLARSCGGCARRARRLLRRRLRARPAARRRARRRDYDVATTRSAEAVQRLFPRTVPVGAQFGVILVLERRTCRSRWRRFAPTTSTSTAATR